MQTAINMHLSLEWGLTFLRNSLKPFSSQCCCMNAELLMLGLQ